MDPFEAAMRSIIKKHVGRGHLDMRVQLASSSGGCRTQSGQVHAARRIWPRSRKQPSNMVSPNKPDLNAAFRVPGILSDTGGLELPAAFEQPLLQLLEQALTASERVSRARRRRARKVMLERNRAIACSGRAGGRDPQQRTAAFHNRLTRAIGGTARQRQPRSAAPGAGSRHAGRPQRHRRRDQPAQDPLPAGGGAAERRRRPRSARSSIFCCRR